MKYEATTTFLCDRPEPGPQVQVTEGDILTLCYDDMYGSDFRTPSGEEVHIRRVKSAPSTESYGCYFAAYENLKEVSDD